MHWFYRQLLTDVSNNLKNSFAVSNKNERLYPRATDHPYFMCRTVHCNPLTTRQPPQTCLARPEKNERRKRKSNNSLLKKCKYKETFCVLQHIYVPPLSLDVPPKHEQFWACSLGCTGMAQVAAFNWHVAAAVHRFKNTPWSLSNIAHLPKNNPKNHATSVRQTQSSLVDGSPRGG